MRHNIYIYLAIMTVVTYAVRVLPLTLIRGRINSVFVRSFLYYVPYVTLSVMTFPAILNATGSPCAGALAFIVGIFAAWKGAGLFKVALLCCAAAFLAELAAMTL